MERRREEAFPFLDFLGKARWLTALFSGPSRTSKSRRAMELQRRRCCWLAVKRAFPFGKRGKPQAARMKDNARRTNPPKVRRRRREASRWEAHCPRWRLGLVWWAQPALLTRSPERDLRSADWRGREIRA